MWIILSSEETAPIVDLVAAVIDADNPTPVESLAVNRGLLDMLKDWRSYPELKTLVEDTPLLKHLLWFTPTAINITPLSELVIHIELSSFDTTIY